MKRIISGIIVALLSMVSVVVVFNVHAYVEASDTTFGGIVATFDAPGESQNGLAWDGTHLWIADAHGPPYRLFKVDPSDGSTVQVVITSIQSVGLTYIEGFLWGCYPWSPSKLLKFDLSGNLLEMYETPFAASMGLAYDGSLLWTVYNTAEDEITTTTLPPGNNTFESRFYSPTGAPYGLAWVNDYLYLSGTSTIYKIDPTNGQVVDSLTDPDHFQFTAGITYDNAGYLWVVDNHKDKLYKVEMLGMHTCTIDELKTEIEELGSEGEISNQGIVNSLIAKLNVAQKLIDDGKVDQAKNILSSFISQVQNLSGIHITPEAADILIKSAEYILSHL